jgi:hypothetical protein
MEQVVAINDGAQKLPAQLFERVNTVVVGQRDQWKDVVVIDEAAVACASKKEEEKVSYGPRRVHATT